MPPIDELRKHLLNSKYRGILNMDGKPMPPKCDIYKEISNLLQNKMTPKYIYTVLLTNRYGLHDALLKYHDIQHHINITMSSVDDDKSFNQTMTETELNFTIKIPLKTWRDIDCEKVIYKSVDKVQKYYWTLRRGRWTNTLFELVYIETKLPCAFMFKRCKISETGIYVTVHALCSDCNSTLIGKIINKPNNNSDVTMDCCIFNFDPSVKHVKKRPLNGEIRVNVSESLAAGTLSAATWRRKAADKIMDMYDEEPPHIYKATTLRKAKQARRDFNLKITGTCALSSLQSMKYSNYAGSIHGIGYDPFFVHYWTMEQIAVYLEHHNILYVDATGSLVKKLQLPNGEQCSHIYLYQAVVSTSTYKMPVFQMLSAVQNVNAIQFWFLEFLRIGAKHKSAFPIPGTIVCDFDKALLNAIAKAFGQCANLKHYLSICYGLLLNEPGIKVPNCFIRLDICHFMHFVSRWKFLLGVHPKVKKFYLYAMALLTKQKIFDRFIHLAKCITVLSLSEDVGKDASGRNVAAEQARAFITSQIKGMDNIKIDEEIVDDNDCIDFEHGLEDCNIVTWAHRIIDECRQTVASSEGGNEINPYYIPKLSIRLKNLLYYFPLFTGVMIPVFGYGQINISSSAVEAEMNDIKHVMLKNDCRPMRADKFVATHILSLSGRAKLAMTSQGWAMEKISPENELTHSTEDRQNTTQFDKSSISAPIESNLDTSKQIRNKTRGSEPDKVNSSLSINENHEICEGLPEAELNVEHNWRNKNSSCSLKKRTYLDTRPDWDACNSSSARVGIGNLQNGNICPVINNNEKRFVVRNTCGFDSIISILAGACVHDKYRDEILNSTSDIMLFIRNFLRDGCTVAIYKERAQLLHKIPHLVSTYNDEKVVTIDSYASIGNIAQYMFSDDPSYVETKVCHVCSDSRIRKSVIVPINVQIIQERGFSRLVNAINDGMPTRKAVCCNEHMEVTLTYGSQIIIECDYQSGNTKIGEFDKSMHLANNSFVLAGVVARYGGTGRRSGHYVGYSYQGTRWMEFDDTKANATVIKCDEFPLQPHLIIYVKV